MSRELMFLMTREQAEEFASLLSAAEQGDGSAATRLGDMYREGAGGVHAASFRPGVQRAAAASSEPRASTQRAPAGVCSFFQNGARVLR